MKTFVSHVDAHQGTSITEETLRCQVDKRTQFVGVSQRLLEFTPKLGWWEHLTTAATVANLLTTLALRHSSPKKQTGHW